MYIDFTSKQYFFILHALAVMITVIATIFPLSAKRLERLMEQAKQTFQVLALL